MSGNSLLFCSKHIKAKFNSSEIKDYELLSGLWNTWKMSVISNIFWLWEKFKFGRNVKFKLYDSWILCNTDIKSGKSTFFFLMKYIWMYFWLTFITIFSETSLLFCDVSNLSYIILAVTQRGKCNKNNSRSGNHA